MPLKVVVIAVIVYVLGKSRDLGKVDTGTARASLRQ